MDLLHIIVLAVVQGFTEFLPISSSAHLILVPALLGWPDQGLAFDVAVHIGTLGAVYVYELDPDEVSPELEWPSWIIYLAIPLGSYLMCFRFLQVMWRFLKTGRVPHQGHGIDYEAPHDETPVAAPGAAQ